jgi:hypothetical protein
MRGINGWEVTFEPLDSLNQPLLGTQSAYLSILLGGDGRGDALEPICDPAFAKGLFVQGTGVQ